MPAVVEHSSEKGLRWSLKSSLMVRQGVFGFAVAATFSTALAGIDVKYHASALFAAKRAAIMDVLEVVRPMAEEAVRSGDRSAAAALLDRIRTVRDIGAARLLAPALAPAAPTIIAETIGSKSAPAPRWLRYLLPEGGDRLGLDLSDPSGPGTGGPIGRLEVIIDRDSLSRGLVPEIPETLWTSIGAALVLSLALISIVVYGTTRRLVALARDLTRAYGGGSLPSRPVVPHHQAHDEIGQLAALFEELMTSNARQIQALRDNETTLRKTLERLELTQYAVDQAADMIMWVDGQGRVRYSNEAARGRLGYTAAELSDLRVWDFDPDHVPAVYEARFASLCDDAAKPLVFETKHRSKTGEIYPVEISSSMLMMGGELISMIFIRDIGAARQAAEDRLRMSRLVTTVFETANAGILVIDVETTAISHANPCSERLFRFAPGTMAGSDFRHLFVESAHDPVLALFSGAETAGSEPKRFDGTFRRADGTSVNIDVSASWFADPGTGRKTGVLVLIDVTERRIMESRLLEAEEIASLGHYEYDWREATFELSPGLQKLLGASSSILTRKEFLHRLDREQYNELDAFISDPSWTKIVRDLQVIGPDGVHRTLELHSFRDVDSTGQHLRRHGTLQDVTARRRVSEQLERQAAELERLNRDLEQIVGERTRELTESENRLQLVLEATDDGIFDSWLNDDGDLVPTYFSPRLCAMIGLPEDGSRLPKVTSHIPIDPVDVARGRLGRLNAVRAGERRHANRFRLVKAPPERDRWYKLSALLIPSADGRVRTIGAITDITDLIEAQRKAEEAAFVKSNFLAKMSHEIRTPLNGILGLVDLLGDTALDARQKQYVSSISYSGELLRTILDEVLDFSRIEAGRMTLEAIAFDPGRLVGEVVALMSGKASAKRLTLSSALAAPLPPAVIGDPTRVRQVLVNLIDNAIKFTPSGSVQVSANCLASDDATARLRFSVSDTGIGIPTDKLPDLFQEFTQADSSISRHYGGTGLGLAICHRLIGLMGSSIAVESEPGRGSRFWFDVSLAVGEPSAVAERRHSCQPLPKLALSILVAEDNVINQMVISGLLERVGATVTIVGSGREVVDLASRADFDLILMDVHMPEMDGLEAARRIRALPDARRAAIPIVALTASVTREEIELYKRYGMNTAIAKPVRGPELIAEITAQVSGRDRYPTALLNVSLVNQRVTDLGVEQTVRIIRLFPDLAGTTVAGIHTDLAEASFWSLAERAHSLAGAASMIGLTTLHGELKALEHAARDEDHERCADLTRSMEVILASSLEVLRDTERRLAEGVPMA